MTDMLGYVQRCIVLRGHQTWDTSGVTTMFRMFSGASSFNQDHRRVRGRRPLVCHTGLFTALSVLQSGHRLWDTMTDDTMEGSMFVESAFDQDVGAWDTSGVRDGGHVLLGAWSG